MNYTLYESRRFMHWLQNTANLFALKVCQKTSHGYCRLIRYLQHIDDERYHAHRFENRIIVTKIPLACSNISNQPGDSGYRSCHISLSCKVIAFGILSLVLPSEEAIIALTLFLWLFTAKRVTRSWHAKCCARELPRAAITNELPILCVASRFIEV